MNKNFIKLIDEAESIFELKEIAHLMFITEGTEGLLATYKTFYNNRLMQLLDKQD